MLGLMKSHGCAFTKYASQTFIKKPQSVSMSW